MINMADEILAKFRADRIEKDGDKAFLDFEELRRIREAYNAGEKTYPINLNEYFANIEAVRKEITFLKEELNKALIEKER